MASVNFRFGIRLRARLGEELNRCYASRCLEKKRQEGHGCVQLVTKQQSTDGGSGFGRIRQMSYVMCHAPLRTAYDHHQHTALVNPIIIYQSLLRTASSMPPVLYGSILLKYDLF